MKFGILTSIAFSLITATVAHAQVAIPMPSTSPIPANDVYICTLADGSGGGAAAVSITEKKFWLLEATQSTEGLTLNIEDVLTARCPNSYSFVVDFMGEKQNGEMTGCIGGDIDMKLSRTPTDSMEFKCIYRP